MKTIFRALGLLVSLACLYSCDGPLRNSGNDDTTGGNRNRSTSDEYVLDNASGKFYGCYYNESTSNLYLTLYSDKMALILDMVMLKVDEPGLVVGKYSCGLSKTAGTFCPGHKETDDEGDYIDGSSVTMSNGKTFPVESGSVQVSGKAGGDYSIKGEVTAGGKEYRFSFEGTVQISDRREDNPGETDWKQFPGADKYEISVNAVYNGNWQNSPGTDYYSLAFCCGNYNSDGNFVDTGFELVFDILTEDSDGKTLKPGTYACTHDDCTPFHFLDGIEEDGVVWPSYFYRQYGTGSNDYTLELVTAGSMTISSTEKGYGFEARFSTYSGTFCIFYDGKVNFSDGNRTNGVMTKASAHSLRAPSLTRTGRAMKAARR